MFCSHRCLGRFLRVGYEEAIKIYGEKVKRFLKFTNLTGHLHSHIACSHLADTLAKFQCGLSSIAPDSAIEVSSLVGYKSSLFTKILLRTFIRLSLKKKRD